MQDETGDAEAADAEVAGLSALGDALAPFDALFSSPRASPALFPLLPPYEPQIAQFSFAASAALPTSLSPLPSLPSISLSGAELEVVQEVTEESGRWRPPITFHDQWSTVVRNLCVEQMTGGLPDVPEDALLDKSARYLDPQDGPLVCFYKRTCTGAGHPDLALRAHGNPADERFLVQQSPSMLAERNRRYSLTILAHGTVEDAYHIFWNGKLCQNRRLTNITSSMYAMGNQEARLNGKGTVCFCGNSRHTDNAQCTLVYTEVPDQGGAPRYRNFVEFHDGGHSYPVLPFAFRPGETWGSLLFDAFSNEAKQEELEARLSLALEELPSLEDIHAAWQDHVRANGGALRAPPVVAAIPRAYQERYNPAKVATNMWNLMLSSGLTLVDAWQFAEQFRSYVLQYAQQFHDVIAGGFAGGLAVSVQPAIDATPPLLALPAPPPPVAAAATAKKKRKKVLKLPTPPATPQPAKKKKRTVK